jgi:hypothetical protein
MSLNCAHALPFISVEISSVLKNRSIAALVAGIGLFTRKTHLFFLDAGAFEVVSHAVEFFHKI